MTAESEPSPRETRREGESSSRKRVRKNTKGGIDRRHWASKVGISFGALKNKHFRELYPFGSHLFDIKGNSYHYLDEGEGEPVVMVHGNPTWSFFYRNLVLGLRRGYRCLVPDHMGCGLSEKPKHYNYDLAHHILNLETWLESILPPPSWNGGKINMIVHDWGGPIGLGYALRHPERINRLVVLNTSAFISGDMPFRIKLCRWPYLGALLVRGFNLFASLATEMTTVKRLPYRVQKAFTMPYNSWKNRMAVHRFIQDIPLEREGRTYGILRALDDGLDKEFAETPMLIQWGMRDWCFTPEFLKMWKKRFPRAEVDQYNAGHYLLEDAGQQILARVKEFLETPVI